MEKSDYLLRQLMLMTQALVSLIRRITGLKDDGTEEEMQQATDVMLKESFDTHWNEIIEIMTDQFVSFMIKKNLQPSLADSFADILIINAQKSSDPKLKQNLFEKALKLLEWNDQENRVYSMERSNKISMLRSQIKMNNK